MKPMEAVALVVAPSEREKEWCQAQVDLQARLQASRYFVIEPIKNNGASLCDYAFIVGQK